MDATATEIIGTLVGYSGPPKTLPESDEMTIDESATMDTHLTNFFKECSGEFQEASVLLKALKDQRIYLKPLGLDIYLVVSVFQRNVTVQIRKFITNEQNELVATRDGITFHLKTWYFFIKHIFGLTLRYRDSSFVCGNSIVVLSAGCSVVLKDIRTSRFLVLNDCHLSILKESIPQLNDKLLTFLYEQYLPSLISELTVPALLRKDNIMLEEVRLCAHIERYISAAMQTEAFFCMGCAIEAPGQGRHACIMTTEYEKYQQVGSTVFLLLDYTKLAMDFVEDNSDISLEFLLNMDFSRVSDVLYKTL